MSWSGEVTTNPVMDSCMRSTLRASLGPYLSILLLVVLPDLWRFGHLFECFFVEWQGVKIREWGIGIKHELQLRYNIRWWRGCNSSLTFDSKNKKWNKWWNKDWEYATTHCTYSYHLLIYYLLIIGDRKTSHKLHVKQDVELILLVKFCAQA